MAYEGERGFKDDDVLADLVKEWALDIGRHPELVVVPAEQDPALELGLMANASSWHTVGVIGKLDSGQDRVQPGPILLGAHRNLPHVDIERLSP